MDIQPPISAFDGHEQDHTSVDYFYDIYDALAAVPEPIEPAVAHSQIKEYVTAVSPRFYDDKKYTNNELYCKCGAKLSFPGAKLASSAADAAQIFTTEADQKKSIVVQFMQTGSTKYDQALVSYALEQLNTTDRATLTIKIEQKNHQSIKDVAAIQLDDVQKSMFLEYVVSMIESASTDTTMF